MSNKICSRCSKEFKYPYLLKKHFLRKNPCKVVEIENNPKTIPKQSQNNPKTIPKKNQKKSYM